MEIPDYGDVEGWLKFNSRNKEEIEKDLELCSEEQLHEIELFASQIVKKARNAKKFKEDWK